MAVINAKFPEKLEFLFRPAPYKVARGGRSGAKSWGFGRALLLLGVETPLRILCAREIQKSIKDSVHQLMKDQIKMLGLESFYIPLDTEIRGKNGTKIIYSGLAEHTVTTIKSFEGIDICWIEEGQAVSKRSLDILIPTIRKEGSEIWVSYNPDLDTDPIHQYFTVHPPEGCINVEINWRDNPWHNESQEQKRLHCQKFDPDNYDNIWEGKCRPAVEGAIYFKEIQQVESQGRICNVPYNPMQKVHIILDLGWSDSLAAGLVQKGVADVKVIEYVEASHTDLNIFSSELKTRPHNWGKVWLPHDGFNGRLESAGKSTYDILKALQWNVAEKEEVVQLSIEEGIRQVRLLFPRLYFDKTKCYATEAKVFKTESFHQTDLNWRLIEILKRYRRHVNQATNSASSPVKDDFAHGADMLRYIACNIDKMSNEDESRTVFIPQMTYQPFDAVIGL